MTKFTLFTPLTGGKHLTTPVIISLVVALEHRMRERKEKVTHYCNTCHSNSYFHQQMGFLRILVAGLLVAGAGHFVWRGMQEPPMPSIDPNPWWGPGEHQKDDTTIRPFKIDVPKAVSD